MVELLSFSGALFLIREGKKLARQGWNGRDMYVALQVPDPGSANTLPYLWMRTTKGDRVPWTVSQTDILAVDWFVVENPAPVTRAVVHPIPEDSHA